MRNIRNRTQTLDTHFGTFLDDRRDTVVKATIDNYNATWGHFCRTMKPDPVTLSQQDVQGYIRVLEQTRNPQGVNSAWRHLRPFLNHLAERGLIDWEPSEIQVPKPGKELKKPLTEAEVRLLVRACRNPRDRAMLLLILDTGIRSRELRELRHSDINFESREAWVRSGKGGQTRSLPFSGATSRAMRAWDQVREPETPWFFHNADHEYGTQMSIWHLHKTFARLGRAAGIPDPVGPHRLRHTFGRAYIASGGNVFALRKMLGHSTLRTSMLYVNLDVEDLRKAHDQISPVKNFLYGK